MHSSSGVAAEGTSTRMGYPRDGVIMLAAKPSRRASTRVPERVMIRRMTTAGPAD